MYTHTRFIYNGTASNFSRHVTHTSSHFLSSVSFISQKTTLCFIKHQFESLICVVVQRRKCVFVPMNRHFVLIHCVLLVTLIQTYFLRWSHWHSHGNWRVFLIPGHTGHTSHAGRRRERRLQWSISRLSGV